MSSRLIWLVFVLIIFGFSPVFAKTFVRESLSTFLQDPAKVRSLLIGVQTMRSRNDAPTDSAEYRTSWEYWAAIHGYTGPAPGTPVAELRQFFEDFAPDLAPFYASFYNGINDISPPDALAEEVWATCRHGGPPDGDIHFLTWHRMYLYFFERVLREASGDPDFALPYWDYTELGTSPDEPWRMPRLFSEPTFEASGQAFGNPLFEPRRTPGFGRNLQLDIARTNIDSSLQLDQFLGFSAGIELGVHGYVHCAVGNACLAPLIGIVPLAGGDPIFWHHHANIDRMMSCWIARHGTEKLPTDQAWLKRSFPFVDENGDRVEMKVAELFDPNGRIDYVYDDVSAAGCFRSPPPTLVASSDAEVESLSGGDGKMITLAQDVSLTGMSSTVPLLPAANRINIPRTLADAPGSTANRVILSLKKIEVEKQPAASLVFDLVSNTNGERRQIGSLNFFALGVTGHGHERVDKTSDGLTFDVTNALAELGVDGLEDVSLDIRAVSLLPSEQSIRVAAEQFEAETPTTHDSAGTLETLQKIPPDRFAEIISDIDQAPKVAVPDASSPITAEDAAIAQERVNEAKITIGEIVLSFGF